MVFEYCRRTNVWTPFRLCFFRANLPSRSGALMVFHGRTIPGLHPLCINIFRVHSFSLDGTSSQHAMASSIDSVDDGRILVSPSGRRLRRAPLDVGYPGGSVIGALHQAGH